MAVIQSLVDSGTTIDVTIDVPVDNVDVHVNFCTNMLDGKAVVKDTCMVRPGSLMNFTIKNPNRANYAGVQCFVEVKINAIGFPDNLLLDETCDPIAISGTTIVSINDITN